MGKARKKQVKKKNIRTYALPAEGLKKEELRNILKDIPSNVNITVVRPQRKKFTQVWKKG